MGGKSNAFAMSPFFTAIASSKVLPINISTNIVEDAIADPHP